MKNSTLSQTNAHSSLASVVNNSDLLLVILAYLQPKELGLSSIVNKLFSYAAGHPLLWENFLQPIGITISVTWRQSYGQPANPLQRKSFAKKLFLQHPDQRLDAFLPPQLAHWHQRLADPTLSSHAHWNLQMLKSYIIEDLLSFEQVSALSRQTRSHFTFPKIKAYFKKGLLNLEQIEQLTRTERDWLCLEDVDFALDKKLLTIDEARHLTPERYDQLLAQLYKPVPCVTSTSFLTAFSGLLATCIDLPNQLFEKIVIPSLTITSLSTFT